MASSDLKVPASSSSGNLAPRHKGSSDDVLDIDDTIEALTVETRLWRPANTAQWVAWGIVQAQVPGLEDKDTPKRSDADESDASLEAEEGDGEFDYLRYARERALFFWGDMVQLGFVAREELPEDVRRDLKVVTC